MSTSINGLACETHCHVVSAAPTHPANNLGLLACRPRASSAASKSRRNDCPVCAVSFVWRYTGNHSILVERQATADYVDFEFCGTIADSGKKKLPYSRDPAVSFKIRHRQTFLMHSLRSLKRSATVTIWLIAGLACAALWAKPAHGAVITFTDRTNFVSATSNNRVTAENFSGNPPGISPIPVNTQFDVGAFNVFYTTANNQSQPTIALRNSAGVQRLDLQFDGGTGAGASEPGRVTTSIEFRFDSELVGFGGDWGALTGAFTSDDGNMLTITVGGDTINIDDLLGNPPGVGDDENGFVGFLRDTPFTSFTLTGTAVFAVDSFSFDNALLVRPPVPEPSTILVTAVFGVGFLHRRRQKTNSAADAASG
jgi:hypothetical protein